MNSNLPRIVLGLVAVSGIALAIAFGMFLYLRLKPLPPNFEFSDFLSGSGGIQGLIAIFTFVFTALGASAIFYVKEQMRRETDLMEIECYRQLLLPEMKSTKRFLHDPSYKSIKEKLAADLATAQMSADSARDLFNGLRDQIDEAAKSIKMPLLGGNSVSFDHIESLINEYNFLSKLLLDKRLAETFGTDMGVANFDTVHGLVEPIIRLRRMLGGKKSKGYANHFSEWVKKMSDGAEK